MRYRITPGLMAKISGGYDVRIPAENELLGDGANIAPARELLPERNLSFNAGFLYSYLKGFDLAKSVTVANWVASKTVQGVGISSLPEEKELNEFIDSYEF